MTGAIVILCVLIVAGIILGLTDKRRQGDDVETQRNDGSVTDSNTEDASGGQGSQESEVCCGQHIVCRKSLSTSLADEAEYFDDEELDRFIGRDPEDYSSDEIEEFREILLSMRPEEIPAWTRSLQIRQVPIPTPVRDEIILLVSEL